MARLNELIKEYHEIVKICNTEPTQEALQRREEIWSEFREIFHSYKEE